MGHSTDPIARRTGDERRESIRKLVHDYTTTLGKNEWWLLEPGDPFYEDCQPFDAIDDDGQETVFFFAAYTPDGEILKGAQLADILPKKWKRYDRSHFRQTPNEFVIGRDGILIVSAGRWGKRAKPDGGFEYLPIEQYWAWRREVDLTSPRTIDNKPAWAEDTSPIPKWKVVDYSTTRRRGEVGKLTLKQRLEQDGSLSDIDGGGYLSFKTAEDLRQIAELATEFADLLDRTAPHS